MDKNSKSLPVLRNGRIFLTLLMLFAVMMLLSACSLKIVKCEAFEGELDYISLLSSQTDLTGYDATVKKENVIANEPGRYFIEYTLKSQKSSRKKTMFIVLEIVDNTAPLISIEGEADEKGRFLISTTIGNEDYLSSVSIHDAVDGDIPLTEKMIRGKIDINKGGTYELKIFASDKSGNKAVQEIIVTVEDDLLEKFMQAVIGGYWLDKNYNYYSSPLYLQIEKDGSDYFFYTSFSGAQGDNFSGILTNPVIESDTVITFSGTATSQFWGGEAGGPPDAHEETEEFDYTLTIDKGEKGDNKMQVTTSFYFPYKYEEHTATYVYSNTY